MSIRIDSEEDGFWLTVEDDEDTGRFIVRDGEGLGVIGYRLRITDPEQLYELVKNMLGPWIDEMRDAKAEYEASKRYGYNPDEDSGYALDDPKHPTYHDHMSDLWDSRRGK